MKSLFTLALLGSVAVANAAIVAYDSYGANDGVTFSGLPAFTAAPSAGTFAQGGTAAVSGIQTTKLLADDITIIPSMIGQKLVRFFWTVSNSDTSATTARMRVRFYKNDPTAGAMGTYEGVGFSFAATPIAPGINGYYFDMGTNVYNLPSKFWFGICFDNSGATATTATKLNKLGMSVSLNAPRTGSSADTMFISTAATGGLANGIPGSFTNFGGTPAANFQTRFETVPEPSSYLAIGLGLAVIARRRRSK